MGMDKGVCTMLKKVAIILSGCGGLDGSEIGETICSMLAIEKGGFPWQAFSADRGQKKVVSAITNKETSDQRNMMEESARITHGKIEDIKSLKVEDFDILWLPGGYGMVSSFSDIGEKGENGVVDLKLTSIIQKFYLQKKIIVGICIAPSVIAKSLENKKLMITLGESDKFYEILKKLGHLAQKTTSEEFIFDKENNIYSTPAYMDKNANLLKIFNACTKIVESIKIHY
jgi:enhancing lycopene biosynthesis protein 2